MKKRHDGLLDWIKQASDEQISSTGTTRAYLKQIGYGNKVASPQIAVKVELASSGRVTRKGLRPDDWHVIWPELTASGSPSSNTPKLTPRQTPATTA